MSAGVAMISRQRDWMCDEGGFKGWKGKWKNTALLSDLTFVLSFQMIDFSYATCSLALVSAVARSGRMFVGEYPLLISWW